MRLMALVSIQDGEGRHAPRTIFEVADEVEGMALVARGFAVEVFETVEDAKDVYTPDPPADPEPPTGAPDGDATPPADPAPLDLQKGKKGKSTEVQTDGGGNTV